MSKQQLTDQNDPQQLKFEATGCCICDIDDAEPIGVGEDFEYRTSNDTYLAVRCLRCNLVFLNPRPHSSELSKIYPDSYHAFAFEAEQYGLIHRVRQRLEIRRLMNFAKGLPAKLRVIDIGCGDGFHLDLLARKGPKAWSLEGIDADRRAASAAQAKGLRVHQGRIEDLQLESDSYDLALMIMTIEHLYDPAATLTEVRRILKPGGRLVVVTDNVGSPDFTWFKGRHWGGYHFPRHTVLFDKQTLGKLAEKCGFQVTTIRSAMSPVNWVYSVRNWIDDWGGPRWLVRQFSLESPLALAVGTAWDCGWTLLNRGAILHGTFAKSENLSSAEGEFIV